MSAGEAWSVEDEAAKLVESLKAAARATPDSPAGTGAPRDPGMSSPTTASAHSAQCQWCPVCRGARFLQSVSPETISRLADLASFAAMALGDLAERQAERAAEHPADDEARGDD